MKRGCCFTIHGLYPALAEADDGFVPCIAATCCEWLAEFQIQLYVMEESGKNVTQGFLQTKAFSLTSQPYKKDG